MWEISKNVIFACRGKQNSRDPLLIHLQGPQLMPVHELAASPAAGCWMSLAQTGLGKIKDCGSLWWLMNSALGVSVCSIMLPFFPGSDLSSLCHIYPPWCCTFPELHSSVMPRLARLKLGKTSLLHPAPAQPVVLCCCFSLLPWDSWLQRNCLVCRATPLGSLDRMGFGLGRKIIVS